MPHAGRRLAQLALVGLVAAVLWAATPVHNLYGTSRPEPIEPAPGAARWPAPAPVVDAVATPMRHRSSKLPLRVPGDDPLLEFSIEREVVERFGREVFEEAAAVWTSVPGAAVTIRVGDVVDDGVDRNTYDGVNRIFMHRRSCSGRTLGRAHIADGDVDHRFGVAVSHVREVNIGLCPIIRAEQVGPVVLHEMGHAIGLGHLCDRDDHHACWEPGMGDESHRCRIMYAAATSYQEWEERDAQATVRLYPVVPRVAGPAPGRTAARLAHTVIGGQWDHDTVIVLDRDVDEELRWTAAAAAGALRAPLLLAPADVSGCGRGEFARELTRVADHGAEVVLVGPAAVRCGYRVDQWELVGTIARDVDALVDLVLERIPTPTGIVVTGVDADGRAPFGAAAAALAGELQRPLLFARGGILGADHLVRVGSLSRLSHAFTLVGPDLRVGLAEAQLRRHHDLEVEAIAADTAANTTVRVAQHETFAEHGSVLVARAGSGDDVVAAAYAPLTSSLLVLTDERMVAGTLRLLGERVTGGFIVGGAVSGTDAEMISRWVDRGDR